MRQEVLALFLGFPEGVEVTIQAAKKHTTCPAIELVARCDSDAPSLRNEDLSSQRSDLLEDQASRGSSLRADERILDSLQSMRASTKQQDERTDGSPDKKKQLGGQSNK